MFSEGTHVFVLNYLENLDSLIDAGRPTYEDLAIISPLAVETFSRSAGLHVELQQQQTLGLDLVVYKDRTLRRRLLS